MKSKRSIHNMGVFVILSMTVLSGSFSQYLKEKDDKIVDLPLIVKEETKLDSGFGPIWTIRIILSREHYSKENLKRLFQYYYRKYPNKNERLYIKVYTSEVNWKREITDLSSWIDGKIPNKNNASQTRSRPVYYDAYFQREPVNRSFTTACNAWYSYSPDLDKPDKISIVVLKGTLRFRKRNILVIKEASNVAIDVRITSYNLEGVDPSMSYYTVESKKNDSGDWQEILSLRQEATSKIPEHPIQFVDDRIAYVFFGYMYACTIDGGNTWAAWDGEYDIQDGKCCNNMLIQDVNINVNGSGKMELGVYPWNLYTNDYGRHWQIQ